MSDLAWMRPKLAELLGYHSHGDRWEDEYGELPSIRKHHFQPDQNPHELLRCLDKLTDCYSFAWRIRRGGEGYWVEVGDLAPDVVQFDASLTRAGCLAIAAALEWKP